MIKGDTVFLSFFGSINVEFSFIGAGQSVFAFTKQDDPGMVWLVVPEHVFHSGERAEDLSKDVLCDAYIDSIANPYLPQINHEGSDLVYGHPELNGRYSKIYRMKYYRDLVRADDELWMQMKNLHRARAMGKNEAYSTFSEMSPEKPSLTFLGNKAAKMSILMATKLDDMLLAALSHLYNNIVKKNVESLTFEFNLRNVGVDENNHLILRDPVYDSGITVKIQHDREEDAKK